MFLTPSTVLQQRYRVERLIGEGGMSSVVLAMQLRLNRPVALKMLRIPGASDTEQARFSEQFETEAQILASLDHPHLARILDFFEEQGHSFLVLEFIQGETLYELVSRTAHGLTEEQGLRLASDLLEALDYLHSRTPPIIVRDLKPHNCIRTPEGRVRLIDFGLAKTLKPNQGTRSIIRHMGSEGFAPMEQYGDAPTDQRSDLYAVGATLYYALSRVVPPGAPTRVTSKLALTDLRTFNSTVSERTWQAVRRLMEIAPEDRPQNVADTRRLLFDTAKPSLAPPPADSPRFTWLEVNTAAIPAPPDQQIASRGSYGLSARPPAAGAAAALRPVVPPSIQLRRRLDGHARQVVALAVSPEGNMVGSGGRDKSVRLFSNRRGGRHAAHGSPDGAPLGGLLERQQRPGGGLR